jgi:hypothetical protein
MMMKLKTTMMNANKLVHLGRFYPKMMASNTAAMTPAEKELFRILTTNGSDLTESEQAISIAFFKCLGFDVKITIEK